MKITNHKVNKGQAMVELALFGGIILYLLGILLQYGLTHNFQQYLKMVTFRRALTLAVNRSQNNAISQINPSVNFVVIQDKIIPNPQDKFEIPDSIAFSSSYSVTYSNKIYAMPDLRKGLFRKDLPGVDVIVNENNPGWLHPEGLTFNYSPPFQAMDTQVGYTSAGWGYIADICSAAEASGGFKKKIDSGDDNGVWWRWETGITCSSKDDKGDLYIREGSTLDIDDDGVEEVLLKKESSCAAGNFDPVLGNNVCTDYIDNYYYIDPNAGELAYGTNLFKEGYQKEIYVYDGTHSSRMESNEGIISTWGTDAKEIIKRKINLSTGEKEITSEIRVQKGREFKAPF